ncbi:unnamed protein product [Moneuplotes crassus]|uniref:Uncharacterized protein n=1 Tax=Euplotes crassus TaxID=5936 RepID=A0AAD1Y976_EUPCR|nr:unnamed protein product [Moneuplotes crassus]
MEEDSYKGDPSKKFVEERLKLNRIIENIHKLEDAIPIIHKMYKEQQKQSETILRQKVKMQEYLTENTIETKFNGLKLDLEGLIFQKLEIFQNKMDDLIHNKVDKEEYTTYTKYIPDIMNNLRANVDKKIANLENDKIGNLSKMLLSKIQEIDLLVNSKANDAELQSLKDTKVSEEDIHCIQEELKQIKSVVSTIEGEENDYNQDTDATPLHRKDTPSVLNLEENSSLRALFQEYLEKIQQDPNKKHLKYQQILLIEAIKKILCDDNRFENMRKEILLQREEIEKIRNENDDLTVKVHNCVSTMDEANSLIEQIGEFKERIEADHQESSKIVADCHKQYQELAAKHSALQTKTSEARKDVIKRLVVLETMTKENQHQISLMHMQKAKFDKITENEIAIKDNEYNLEKAVKDFEHKLQDFKNEYILQTEFFNKEIDSLGDPVRQALEKNQRESDNMMNELKNVQKESRDIFSEFEKSKSHLLDVISALKSDQVPVNACKSTVSTINLDTKILKHDYSTPSFKTPAENLPKFNQRSQRSHAMSPITFARTTTAQTSQSKLNCFANNETRTVGHLTLNKASNITSKPTKSILPKHSSSSLNKNSSSHVPFPGDIPKLSRTCMSRPLEGKISQSDILNMNDPDQAIREEDEGPSHPRMERTTPYTKHSQKKLLFLKSRLNKKPIRYNEEMRRSKSAMKGKTSGVKIGLF